MSDKNAPAMPQNKNLDELNTEEKIPWEIPEWKVSGIFSSHMVLQRNEPIKVWGWSTHIGAEVEGLWKNEKARGQVDKNGRFELIFNAKDADNEPSTMIIKSDFGCDIFEDILVGDVWVIGGQSNAEHHLEPCLADTPEIESEIDENKPIRLFRQTQRFAYENKEMQNFPMPDIINPEWRWKRPDESAAKEFSAIGASVKKSGADTNQRALLNSPQSDTILPILFSLR